jgi:hypothetical protein
MGKIINQKSFKYFVWTPLGSRVNIKINFFSFPSLLSDVSSLILLPLFAMTPVGHQRQPFITGGKYATGINDTSGTSGFAAGVVDTGVVDTGGVP